MNAAALVGPVETSRTPPALQASLKRLDMRRGASLRLPEMHSFWSYRQAHKFLDSYTFCVCLFL